MLERISQFAPKQDVLRALQKFLTAMPVKTAHAAERKHGYVWSHLNIFLPLLETDVVEVQRIGAYVMAYFSLSGKQRRYRH